MILVDVSYVQNFETKRLQANKCVKKKAFTRKIILETLTNKILTVK